MTYSVKEFYLTLQGEGANVGRTAVFCRFSGCNLWTGREQDRAAAQCTFCDTEFVGTDGPNGGTFRTADELAKAASEQWPDDEGGAPALVVCTGGEPLLQLDRAAIDAFHRAGFEVAVETNGTIKAPPGIDWICVSPKATTEIRQAAGNELKLVYPQRDAMPSRFEHLAFDHFFLQPMDGPNQAENIRAATEFCLRNPRWRLSLQTHKLIGIP